MPTNQTLLEGQALILSVSVLGSLPQYQWYKNDVAIPNATNRTYQVLHALPGDSGSYYVKVWNHINSTNTPSVNIVVTSEPLVITNGLQDMGVFEASTVVLTIGVSGTFPQYKWYKNNQPISGATNSSLTITNFSPADAGTYMVLITNSTSQVTSTAKLTYIADTIPPKIVSAIASTNLLTVDVLFSEPVSNEATDYGNYLLIPEGGYPITPLDVLKTSPTNFTLSFLPGDIRYGKHYSISASYIFDTSRQFNEVDSTPVPIAMYYGNLISIDESTMWRFESRGYDYSNAWYRLDFDDSGWSNGAALFVSKEGTIPTYPQPIRTFMNASNYLGTEKVCTYYFRTWFKFTGDDPQHSAIVLKTIIDDGAIFYLNGKEIYRLGMPAGTVTSSTYANRTIGDAAYEGPFTIALPGLVSGSNLVAVEVHNADASSSDVVFGMEILEILPAIVPVEFLHPLSDKVINEGESLSLSVSVTGVSPVYQWYKDNVPIQGATSPIYTIPIARPNDSGVYKVVVTNLISVIESSASITVNPDTTPPSVISAIASANLTTITITYSELVDPFSSQDPGNYSITPTEGGAAVDILSVMLMNETNVVITTTPMQQGIIYSVTINNVSDLSTAGNILQNYTHNIIATDFVFPVFTDWKYNNSGIDLGSDWYKVNYSDSTWQTGTALFGLESNTFVDNNPINTPFTLNNGSGTYITTFYFRKWFTFPYRTNGVKLAFMHAIDDGAIFYINGVEVYRYNMPQGNV
ncbi:MAG TPA: immunoglobulin domain-containing protein, partial [Verrucomicrobiota bacterium]|nr:immunoglobulin domain-containing protein [Verrucomicrobiota bacterium]